MVQCQNERSQSSNRATAMAMLRSKLVEAEERRRKEEIARERGEAQDVNFGSQIRSYVLHPYTMVKDHRTDHEVGNAQGVLDGDLEIEDDDLQIDTYRASGAGGQHVNKTDSAVRITHRPTCVVVQCQNERSQSANRATAMAMLRSRLIELEERKRQEEIARERGEAQDVNFGSQIRSYVLHPYTMVKDHRTDFEVGSADRVLDGDLDGFVRAWLEANARTSAN